MGYLQWFEAHAHKHSLIVNRLVRKGFSDEAIIDYFDFDNMVTAEPHFCPLYAQQQKCHDMLQLNCYLCACPNFRFNDDGIRRQEISLVKSECQIDKGTPFLYDDIIHQDCSSCTVPHHRSYIKKYFSTDWKRIMKSCQ